MAPIRTRNHEMAKPMMSPIGKKRSAINSFIEGSSRSSGPNKNINRSVELKTERMRAVQRRAFMKNIRM